jgi:hypothetical protein
MMKIEMLSFLKNLSIWILNEDTCLWEAPVAMTRIDTGTNR